MPLITNLTAFIGFRTIFFEVLISILTTFLLIIFFNFVLDFPNIFKSLFFIILLLSSQLFFKSNSNSDVKYICSVKEGTKIFFSFNPNKFIESILFLINTFFFFSFPFNLNPPFDIFNGVFIFVSELIKLILKFSISYSSFTGDEYKKLNLSLFATLNIFTFGCFPFTNNFVLLIGLIISSQLISIFGSILS